MKVVLSKVDPSDCVDMDCDGRRKVIIEDHDNSFFKKDAPTTLISKSEVEWSGDGYTGNTKYGLGKHFLLDIGYFIFGDNDIRIFIVETFQGVHRQTSKVKFFIV